MQFAHTHIAIIIIIIITSGSSSIFTTTTIVMNHKQQRSHHFQQMPWVLKTSTESNWILTILMIAFIVAIVVLVDFTANTWYALVGPRATRHPLIFSDKTTDECGSLSPVVWMTMSDASLNERVKIYTIIHYNDSGQTFIASFLQWNFFTKLTFRGEREERRDKRGFFQYVMVVGVI